jgi:hypothetical protein
LSHGAPTKRSLAIAVMMNASSLAEFDEMVVMLMAASAEVSWVPADVALPDSLRVPSRDDIQ